VRYKLLWLITYWLATAEEQPHCFPTPDMLDGHERSRTNDLDAEDKKTVDRRRWHTSPALLILDLDYLIPRSVAQGRGFDEIPAKKGGGDNCLSWRVKIDERCRSTGAMGTSD
jgi:hypothetical protein